MGRRFAELAFTPLVKLRDPDREPFDGVFWPSGGASIGYAW